MAKANISLPNGTVVTVSGTPDEVAAVLSRLQAPVVAAPARAARPSAQAKAGRERPELRKQPTKLPDLIATLLDGGFFKQPRDLAAIKTALEELGHHYPVTTLSPAMLRLTRKRAIRRLKQDGRWVYTHA